MRRKNIRYYTIAWISLCLVMGCSDFLDKEPENKVSTDIIFSDMQGAKSVLAGVYESLFEATNYNGLRMVYPDLTGGNLVPVGTSENLINNYHFVDDAANSSMNALYASHYSMLNVVNQLISRSPNLSDGDTPQRNELLAQAHGLRALLHLNLVQLYAQPYHYTSEATHDGIILVTSPIMPADAQQKRADVAAVYDRILSDLKTAESLFLNRTVIFSGHRSIYMNPDAIKALLARAYLNMGIWKEAHAYSDAIIRSNYSLYSTEEYVDAWKQSAVMKESILELAVPSSFAGNSLGHYYINATGNRFYQFVPSQDLLQLYDKGDIRSNGGLFKYPTLGIDATSVKLIRLAEIYLIRAEASAELGNYGDSMTDLHNIQQRADPGKKEYSFVSKADLVHEIITERRRELALEGFLFFDLMRRSYDVDRTDCEGENCTVIFPSEKFVLPIPQQSVLTNTRMKQNPGY